MAETKFLDKAGLTRVLENANAKFSKVGHKHTKAEITDFEHTHDDRYYTETEIDTKVNALNSAIAGKAASGHNHDDRYYTETEMDTKLAGKSDTTHSHTTHLTTEIVASADLNAITTPGWYKCSVSATAAGLTNSPTKVAFAMEVLSNAGTTQKVYEYSSGGQKIYTRNLYDGAWGAWERVYTTANKPTLAELGAASSGHTHNYAGSSSAGGSANSAVKLDSSAGSATQPVYFSGGKPVATTYTLGKSVPADAVFTDTNTHYASKNVVGGSTATSNTTTALTNGNVYINSVENGAVTSAHKISGTGTTTVTTDASGNIVINSTAHPSAIKNPNALTISLDGASQGAYDGSAAKSFNITASSVGAAAASHNHSAANITSGTLDIARIPNVNDKVTSVDVSKLSGVIDASHLPSYVDDVLEGYYNASDGKFYKTYDSTNKTYGSAYTGETGKIYVNLSDNKTYRWSGTAYVVISETLALGETESTAYRGDRGKVAYDHATAHGSAFASGLYKITTNAAGHVTAATAVAKADITKLGIPAQDTVYTHPTSSGNKHIPSGGASGQILRWSADGTAVWGADNNTWIAFKGATTDADGTAGYAPAPSKGAANRYLRSDGTWVVPPNTTYSDMNGATSSAAGTHGLVPAPAAGKQTSFLRGDGTWVVPTNTDTKVSQTAIDTANYTNWRTIPWGASRGATEGFTPATVTDGVFTSKNLSFQPSSGTLKATTFKGALSGKATSAASADSATKATQDSAGQQINTTYIKGLSVNGRTITYTKGDGTTGTITTQDTNTTYAALTNDEIDACFTAVFG